ncbi:unnamed protein product [Larinioides sclopetarius]|uniref:Uncharacterized protein n=1 Tax=Larinioides sclopetarius TaxID=280406 RepID=A0AAV1ZVH7_9ARAC
MLVFASNSKDQICKKTPMKKRPSYEVEAHLQRANGLWMAQVLRIGIPPRNAIDLLTINQSCYNNSSSESEVLEAIIVQVRLLS